MANVIAELLVSVGADISGLQSGMSRVTATIENAGRAATRVGGTLTAGITAPLAGIGIAAVAAASDFQSNMNTFQAVSDATGVEMAKLQQLAMDLGEDMTLPGTSAADAAEAMTELSKAGLNVESTMGAVEGVLRLSAAAEIGNAEAAEIAANALNAFGLEGSEANRVADLLAAAANASAADIGDMAAAMKMGSTVFAAAGIPIEDLTTNISLMANAGIKGSDAGTSLKTMLMRLQVPTDAAAAAMESLGISVYDAQGTMMPMQNLVGQFSTAMSGLTDEQRNATLATIFGADAIRAANVVLMGGSDAWSAMKTAVTETGAAQELSAVKMQGVGGALEGLKSTIESTLTTAALPFLSVVEGIIRTAAEWISKIGEINPNMIALAATIGVAVAVIGPLALGIGALVSVLGAILSPIGLIIAGVVALGAAWVTNFGGIRTTTEEIFGAVQTKIQDVIDTVGPYVESFVSTVTGWFEENWPQIQSTVETVFNAVSAVVNTVVSEVSGFIEQEFGLIISWVQENWPLIQRTIETVLNTIWDVISGIVADIQRLWEQHGENIMRVVRTIWETIKTIVDSAIKIVLGIVKAVMQAINGDWEGAWETIKTTVTTVWENIKGVIEKWINLAKDVIEDVLQKISDWVNDKLQEIKQWFENRWNEIIAFLQSIDLVQIGKDIIQGLIDGIISMAQGVIDSVIGVINDAIAAAKRLLGISSPSKLAASEIGVPIIKGIIMGAESAAPDAANALAQIVSDIMRAASGAVVGINAGAGGMLTGLIQFVSDLVKAFHEATTWITTAAINVKAQADAFNAAAQGMLDTLMSAVNLLLSLEDVVIPSGAAVVRPLIQFVNEIVQEMHAAISWITSATINVKAQADAFTAAAKGMLETLMLGVELIEAVGRITITDKAVATIRRLVVVLSDMVRQLSDIVRPMAASMLAMLRFFADQMKPVLELFTLGMNLLSKLSEFKPVDVDRVFHALRQVIIDAVRVMRDVNTYVGHLVDDAKVLAEKLTNLMAPITEALAVLVAAREFKPVDVDRVFHAIRQVIIDAIRVLRDVNAYVGHLVDDAKVLAGKLAGIMAPIGDALDVLVAAQEFKPVDVDRVFHAIRQVIIDAVRALRDANTHVGHLVDGARVFAERVSPVLGVIRGAVDALNALLELPAEIRDVKPAVAQLGVVITEIASAIAAAASNFAGPVMDAAKAFAEKVGPVIGIVRGGVDAFKALLEMPRTLPDIDLGIGILADFIYQLADAIADVAGRIDAKLMSAASEFATKAGAVVGLVSQAVTAITALEKLKPPQLEVVSVSLDLLALFVEQVAIKVGEVAQRIDTKLVAAASEFAAAVGQPLSLIGQAVDLFNKIAEFRIYTGVFDKLDTIISHIWNVLRKIGNLRDAFTEDVLADAKFVVEQAVPAMQAIQNAMMMLNNIGQVDLSRLSVVAYNSGVNWIHALADGIRSGLNYLEAALQAVANLFPHSPAKEGPLSKPVDWEAYLLGNLGDAASQVAMALAPVGTRGMLGPAPTNNQALSYQVVINNPTGRPAEDSLRRELAYLSRGISWA